MLGRLRQRDLQHGLLRRSRHDHLRLLPRVRGDLLQLWPSELRMGRRPVREVPPGNAVRHQQHVLFLVTDAASRTKASSRTLLGRGLLAWSAAALLGLGAAVSGVFDASAAFYAVVLACVGAVLSTWSP